jgi:hypothetical protein
MRARSRALSRGFAVTLVALALCAGVVALMGDRSARAAHRRVPSPSLIAGISTHAPCGDPVALTARLLDPSRHSLRGVKVTFSFKLRSGLVRRHAHTTAKGVARVIITPGPATAPQGVRVTVKARAVFRGLHLTAATWFTPKYT